MSFLPGVAHEKGPAPRNDCRRDPSAAQFGHSDTVSGRGVEYPDIAPGPTPAIAPLNAFATGMAASLVLGAPDFTTTWTGPNASAFAADPMMAAMDNHGDVWVADTSGNRVMEFAPPFTKGEAASVFLGQSDSTGSAPGTSAKNLSDAAGLTLDSHGDLWVSDLGNNRVLEFVPPFHTGMAASLVLGQTEFSGNAAGTSAVNLSEPWGLSFDPLGDLWLADTANDRVLEYFPPFSTGMSASLVIGQSDFSGNLGGTLDTNLSGPIGVTFADNILWVADQQNNRVVGYYAPFSTGEAAFYLLGQSAFGVISSTGEASLTLPNDVAVDSLGNVWVSGGTQNRVLEFPAPYNTFEDPIVAIGQNTLTGVLPGTTATNLTIPVGVFFDPSGNLWVTDTFNNRILEYIPPHFAVTVSDTGLPGGTSWTAAVDGQGETGIGSLQFSEDNGTHILTVPPVPGFRPKVPILDFSVNAAATPLTVTFVPATPNPFSSGIPATVGMGTDQFRCRLPVRDRERERIHVVRPRVGLLRPLRHPLGGGRARQPGSGVPTSVYQLHGRLPRSRANEPFRDRFRYERREPLGSE